MTLKEPTMKEQVADAVKQHLSHVENLNKKLEKWYFRPSVPQFTYILDTTVRLIEILRTSAAVIDSQDQTIESYKREVDAHMRLNASLERRISRLTEENTSLTIKINEKD